MGILAMPDSVTAKRQRNTLSFLSFVCVCVCVCLSVCLSVPACLSVCLSLSVCMYVCLSENAILAVRAIGSITKDAIVLSVIFAAILKRRFLKIVLFES